MAKFLPAAAFPDPDAACQLLCSNHSGCLEWQTRHGGIGDAGSPCWGYDVRNPPRPNPNFDCGCMGSCGAPSPSPSPPSPPPQSGLGFDFALLSDTGADAVVRHDARVAVGGPGVGVLGGRVDVLLDGRVVAAQIAVTRANATATPRWDAVLPPQPVGYGHVLTVASSADRAVNASTGLHFGRIILWCPFSRLFPHSRLPTHAAARSSGQSNMVPPPVVLQLRAADSRRA